jgi:hypothetical protein
MSSINPVPVGNAHLERATTEELAAALAANSRSVKPVKQARDRAQYVRQQKGHSLILWLFLWGPMTLWIPTIYFAASPNHYWHA